MDGDMLLTWSRSCPSHGQDHVLDHGQDHALDHVHDHGFEYVHEHGQDHGHEHMVRSPHKTGSSGVASPDASRDDLEHKVQCARHNMIAEGDCAKATLS